MPAVNVLVVITFVPLSKTAIIPPDNKDKLLIVMESVLIFTELFFRIKKAFAPIRNLTASFEDFIVREPFCSLVKLYLPFAELIALSAPNTAGASGKSVAAYMNFIAFLLSILSFFFHRER